MCRSYACDTQDSPGPIVVVILIQQERPVGHLPQLDRGLGARWHLCPRTHR